MNRIEFQPASLTARVRSRTSTWNGAFFWGLFAEASGRVSGMKTRNRKPAGVCIRNTLIEQISPFRIFPDMFMLARLSRCQCFHLGDQGLLCQGPPNSEENLI